MAIDNKIENNNIILFWLSIIYVLAFLFYAKLMYIQRVVYRFSTIFKVRNHQVLDQTSPIIVLELC